jgi:cytochrome c553
MAYQEKLKDPRWQKKRLEILERDDFTCQSCCDTETTLNVHHKYYQKCDPWEYNNEALLTLCEDCHSKESRIRSYCEKNILRELRRNFLAESVSDLAVGISAMKLLQSPDVVASVYAWAFSDENIQRELIEKYFENLKKSRPNATA